MFMLQEHQEQQYLRRLTTLEHNINDITDDEELLKHYHNYSEMTFNYIIEHMFNSSKNSDLLFKSTLSEWLNAFLIYKKKGIETSENIYLYNEIAILSKELKMLNSYISDYKMSKNSPSVFETFFNICLSRFENNDKLDIKWLVDFTSSNAVKKQNTDIIKFLSEHPSTQNLLLTPRVQTSYFKWLAIECIEYNDKDTFSFLMKDKNLFSTVEDNIGFFDNSGDIDNIKNLTIYNNKIGFKYYDNVHRSVLSLLSKEYDKNKESTNYKKMFDGHFLDIVSAMPYIDTATKPSVYEALAFISRSFEKNISVDQNWFYNTIKNSDFSFSNTLKSHIISFGNENNKNFWQNSFIKDIIFTTKTQSMANNFIKKLDFFLNDFADIVDYKGCNSIIPNYSTQLLIENKEDMSHIIDKISSKHIENCVNQKIKKSFNIDRFKRKEKNLNEDSSLKFKLYQQMDFFDLICNQLDKQINRSMLVKSIDDNMSKFESEKYIIKKEKYSPIEERNALMATINYDSSRIQWSNNSSVSPLLKKTKRL